MRARGVSRAYRDGPARGLRRGLSVALHPTDLTIEHGESVGIIGESGSGKSTLLRQLTALDTPTAGTVEFHGRSLAGLSGRDLHFFRRHTGVIFQDPYSSLDPRLTVGQIVGEPLSGLRISGDRRARVATVIAQVGLDPDLGERYPHQLSGGQRQRVAIARAIVHEPTLLVGDEPLSALDVTVRAQILDLLVRLRTEMGLSLLLVSHDLGVVQELCETVAVMSEGRIVERGATAEVFRAPRHPYTGRLLASALTLPE